MRRITIVFDVLPAGGIGQAVLEAHALDPLGGVDAHADLVEGRVVKLGWVPA